MPTMADDEMSDEPSFIVIRHSRLKLAFSFTLTLALTALFGVFLFTVFQPAETRLFPLKGEMSSWQIAVCVMLLMMLLCVTAVAAMHVITPGRIVLDGYGFTMRTVFGTYTYGWPDIGEFRFIASSGFGRSYRAARVECWLSDAAVAHHSRRTHWEAFLGAWFAGVPSGPKGKKIEMGGGWELSADDLHYELDAARRIWGLKEDPAEVRANFFSPRS